jgi:hypothetical protein
MLTDEQIQDGLAFARLVADDRTWPALQRLVARFNDSAIAKWEQDDKDQFTKKWLRGYRECAGDVLPAVVQLAQDAQAAVQAAKDLERVEKFAEDGMGSGDLAIA